MTISITTVDGTVITFDIPTPEQPKAEGFAQFNTEMTRDSARSIAAALSAELGRGVGRGFNPGDGPVSRY